MKLSKHTKYAYLALFVASVIWGITSPVMKHVLETVPLFSLAFIRFAGASLILLPFVWKHLEIERKDYFKLLMTGLTGITLVIYLFFAGVKLTSASNSSILLATVPLFTVFLARFFLKEELTRRVLIGAICGMLGVSVIFGHDLFSKGVTVAPIGDFLVLLSSLSFAVYEIFSKKLFATYRPIVISFYAFVIGTVTFFPFAYNEFLTNPSWMSTIHFDTFLGILFGIFFSSTAAFSLWQWGLSKVSASESGFFLYISPIVATIFSTIFLDEVISLLFIIGSIFIFSGVFIAQQHHNHPVVHRLKNIR